MENIKLFYNENKKAIKIGVVVSLISTIILLTITYFFGLIIDWIKLVSPLFSDYYYQSITSYNESDLLGTQYLFISSIFFYLFFKFSSEISDRMISKIEDCVKLRNDTNELINKDLKIIKENKISETDLNNKAIDLKNKADENILKLKKLIKYFRIFILILFVLVSYLHIKSLFNQILSTENNYFNKKVLIIKPYIEQNEYDIIISEWYQMKNKNDYDKIYNKIKKIEKDTNVKN